MKSDIWPWFLQNRKSLLKGDSTMQTSTKEWVMKTLETLRPEETKQLIDYMEFLVWKSQKTRQKGQPSRILEAINKSHEVTMEDAEALLQSIKEGEIRVREQ